MVNLIGVCSKNLRGELFICSQQGLNIRHMSSSFLESLIEREECLSG